MNHSEAGKLGWLKSKEKHEARAKLKKQEYSDSPKLCLNCKEALTYEQRDNDFCSHICAGNFNHDKKGVKEKQEIKCHCGKVTSGGIFCSLKCDSNHRQQSFIKDWQSGIHSGISGTYSISKRIRRYLIEKYNSKCSLCGWSEENPHTKKVPLEIECIAECGFQIADCKNFGDVIAGLDLFLHDIIRHPAFSNLGSGSV